MKTLDIIAKDELNNPVFTIIGDKILNIYNVKSPSWLKAPTTFTAIGKNNEEFGKVQFKYSYSKNNSVLPNTTASVFYYDVLSNGRVFTQFTLRAHACRPGFVQQGDTCVCDKSKTGILGYVLSRVYTGICFFLRDFNSYMINAIIY